MRTLYEGHTDHARVIVTECADGSMLVSTFRLAPDASAADPDPIVWNDDVSVHVPAQHERPTAVLSTPHTYVTTAEPLPF